MAFQTRNSYYLRISERIVLPLHLYLDERHLDWMSDVVLQHVLADIRPHIVTKLQMEASLFEGVTSSKKAALDTHRGDTYQFCYFFRKAEPHSVVIKTRNFVATSSQKQPQMVQPDPPSSKPQQRKRMSKFKSGHNEVTRKKRKTRSREQNSDEDGISTSTDGESLLPPHQFAPRRPRHSAKKLTGDSLEERANPDAAGESEVEVIGVRTVDRGIDEAESVHTSDPSNTMVIDVPHRQEESRQLVEIELEEEEEKPKPMLRLRYQGFNILGSCLCVVVEPWPPLQPASRVRFNTSTLTEGPATIGTTLRPISLAHHRIREKTPLFLPEDYAESRENPAMSRGWNPNSASSLLDSSFLEDSEDSDSENGMILFSQILNNTGGIRAGAAEEDEKMDTDMFFGDADEIRELR